MRKYVFRDARRGGLLGMGSILTLTTDAASPSPIHRGVWFMENVLGSHPDPLPSNVVIEEPDLHQAKTIREVLKAHNKQEACAETEKEEKVQEKSIGSVKTSHLLF